MKLMPALLAVTMLLAGCAGASDPTPGGEGTVKEAGFQQITQEEAMRIMAEETGYVILDVRTKEEYGEGHIPGAVCVPNELINCDAPEALTDYNQMILVYCRSGNRSKQAAQKLASMGFTRVYEFGGINTWPGEIVAEEPQPETEPATLTYSSFDGGGPEYEVAIEDPSVVACTSSRKYDKPDHDEMTGASYNVIFSFPGLKEGTTALTVSARSPIAENFDETYTVSVDHELKVTLRLESTDRE